MEGYGSFSADASRLTVVIAEDNRLNQELLHDYLAAWGYTVYTAWDGEQAVEVSQANRPDLIVMDIQMPQSDGIEAIGKIRATPTLADVPIIALTALAMAGDRERCLAAGADAYMAKPIELRALRAVAGELIAQRRARGAKA